MASDSRFPDGGAGERIKIHPSARLSRAFGGFRGPHIASGLGGVDVGAGVQRVLDRAVEILLCAIVHGEPPTPRSLGAQEGVQSALSMPAREIRPLLDVGQSARVADVVLSVEAIPAFGVAGFLCRGFGHGSHPLGRWLAGLPATYERE